MAITISDLADICNVSKGTVDRALNGRSGIKEETRNKILLAARENKYMPNKIAQSLVTGNTMTIGVVCFDLYNNFFAMLVDIIEAAAKQKGYFINLVLTHGDIDKEMQGMSYLFQRNIDGIIIFPVVKGTSYEKYLLNFNIPIVTIYNKISDKFIHIGVNDRDAMRNAVVHMVKKGYKRILFFTVDMDKRISQGMNLFTLEQRQMGYLDGIKETGIQKEPIIIEKSNFKHELENYIGHGQPKSGVLCICDSYALTLLNYCKSKRVSVPDDIGIMGYDNIDMLHYITPRLSTVEYDVVRMGNILFNTLYDMINGNIVKNDIQLDYSILEGESL